MAVSKEIIRGILNFDPSSAVEEGRVVVEGQQIDLGEVDHHRRIVYGNYNVQERLAAIYNPNEPLLVSWRTRPVVALETFDSNGCVVAVTTLAYVTDVRSLGEELAGRVLDCLNAVRREPHRLAA